MSLSPTAFTSLVLIVACGCGGGSERDDGVAIDARDINDATASAIDATAIDATAFDAAIDASDTVHIDAGGDAAPDAAAQGCQLGMTAAQACAIAWRAEVHACSIDPQSGAPSLNGWLDVARPDGTHGYLCATNWTRWGGYFFDERRQLFDSASACCGGARVPLAWPIVDAAYGTAHGPTHVKPWETTASPDGALRTNPFAIVVSSSDSAATFQTQRALWSSWAADGQPHPAPDGSGSWWFRYPLAIQYVLVPTTDGRPLIVIAPDVSPDAELEAPQGHPTLGACPDTGGAPFAYVGGEITHGTRISNRSGRFGHESTITQANLQAAADLFNCYGIPIATIDYVPPE
ncbi:MAG TPA: hypothetical protein VM261_36900 [Kofleriaceae bacterium]|nr:hypothetical protein [Kofleriaceae bacterium]